MKIGYLSILFLFFSTSLWAQNPLEVRLSYRVNDMLLKDALYELSERAKISLSFSESMLPADEIVSLKVKNKSVGYILDELLANTSITYRLVGGQVLLIAKPPPAPNQRFTISGYLLDAESGEPLIGATIQDVETGRGAFSNTYGFYSLTVTAGTRVLRFGYLGYQPVFKNIHFINNRRENIELEPSITLQEVIIYERDNSAKLGETEQIGTQILYINQIKSLPSIGGEADIIKVAQTLPGVQTGADGYGGFSVRGGNVDQNLVLMDGVPIYNSLHSVGLFSVFNSSIIQRSEFFKGSFPARYGGRASSVIDIRIKEGNNRKIGGEFDGGPLSAKILLEGPIKKDKSSFVFAARRSFLDFYADAYANYLQNNKGENRRLLYYFYDINAKVNYKFSERDKIFLSGYGGQDRFFDRFIIDEINLNTSPQNIDNPRPDSIASVFAPKIQRWGNFTNSLRWNHVFSQKLFSNTTLTYTRFFYLQNEQRETLLTADNVPFDTLFQVNSLNSNNQDVAAKIDFDYYPSAQQTIKFGVHVTGHQFQPRLQQTTGNIPLDTFNQILSDTIRRPSQYLAEYDAYFEDEFKVGNRWNFNLGARFSAVHTLNKIYFYPQPRLAANVRLDDKTFLKVGASYLIQPLHLLTVQDISQPTDLWVGATSRIKPVQAYQGSLGLEFRPDSAWVLSAETYYKELYDIVSLREGIVEDLDASNWQNLVVQGRGQSCGLELNFAKRQGRTTGWLSYTWSNTTRQFPEQNIGKKFPFKFDRRHNLSIVFNHKISPKWEFSANYTFQSGININIPQARYYFIVPTVGFPFNGFVNEYDSKNNIRLPNYHRLDMGFNVYLKTKPLEQTLKFGVYNIYDQRNPAFYRLREEFSPTGEVINRYYSQVTFVPILPYFRYTFSF